MNNLLDIIIKTLSQLGEISGFFHLQVTTMMRVRFVRLAALAAASLIKGIIASTAVIVVIMRFFCYSSFSVSPISFTCSIK
jgi:hypothetical protein